MIRGALAVAALLLAAAAPRPVALTGLVKTQEQLSPADLRALPQARVEASFGTMHGVAHHTWSGPLLWAVLGHAGITDAPGKRTFAQHTILITGSDGYAAALAIGEIDPQLENKQVLVALREEDTGTELAAPRLIVPGDAHGARSVHDVVGIEVR